jgi:threonine 3-dehydrogenase
MGGFVNVLSVYGETMPEVPMNEVVFRYLHLKGINGRKMWSTWDRMHALLEAGAIDVAKVVTHTLPVAEFKQGMALSSSGECGKVVLTFPDPV